VKSQHFWGFPLYRLALLGIRTLSARWTKKGRFPTLQPLSKTKLSVQA